MADEEKDQSDKASNSKSHDEVLELAKERFKISEEAFNKFREDAEDDLRFRVGEQWDEKLRSSREREGRPCLTVNRIQQFCNQIINDIRQNRPALKVYPVDDKADKLTAKIIQGIFRHIEYQSGADVAYDTAVESAVNTGLGFFRVYPEFEGPTSFNQKIRIAEIDNLFSVLFDPYSKRPDGSDATFAFVYSDLSKKEFKHKYPKAKSCDSRDWSDKETPDGWIKKDSVRVCEYFCKEYETKKLLLLSTGDPVLEDDLEKYLTAAYQRQPELQGQITIEDQRDTEVPVVKWYKLSGDEVLEETDFPAPFIPIIPVYGSVTNINGEKFIQGIIRGAKDPQKMYNIWVSAETEMIALSPKAPFIGYEGQFEGKEAEWATANTKTHAYLEVKPITVGGQPAPLPQRANFEPAVMAITQARMGAGEDMKAAIGIYDAGLGAVSNETSGVAIRGRQQQSQTANFHFADNLTRSIRHLGRIVIHMLPKIYDTARIARVMGEDGTEEPVKINQPVVMNGVERVFDLTVGEYDVAVETGPSFATKRQEAVASIMDFIRAYPAAAQVVGDLLVKNMDWPEAQEISERLKKTIPPHLLGEGNELPPQAQAQIQQMQQALQTMQGALQAANLKLQTKELELQSKERIEFAKIEADLRIEEMKLPTVDALSSLQAEIQQLQMRQEMVGFNQPISYLPPQMPQQQPDPNFNGNPPVGFAQQGLEGDMPAPNINPTGGIPPG